MTEHPTASPSRIDARLLLLLATTALLAACGSRQPPGPEAAPPVATASNTVVMPLTTYGKTAKGLQLFKTDDPCDAPASLQQAVEDQLLPPIEFLLTAPTPATAGAPVLKVEITDILANGGGMYGGPKIVQLRGTLERNGQPTVSFTAQRQVFIQFGFRGTCSMVGSVTYTLGGDIAGWLQKPVDGAVFGEF